MSGKAGVQRVRGCLGQKETGEGERLDSGRTMEVVWIMVSPDTYGKPLSVLTQVEDGNGGG